MNLVRSLGSVGGLTLVSRVLALVRDTLQTLFIGASFASDAFFVAFRLPNMFRALFAEGAFNAAFIPMFNRKLGEEGDRSAALDFAERALSVLFAFLLAMTAVMLAPDPLAAVLVHLQTTPTAAVLDLVYPHCYGHAANDVPESAVVQAVVKHPDLDTNGLSPFPGFLATQ